MRNLLRPAGHQRRSAEEERRSTSSQTILIEHERTESAKEPLNVRSNAITALYRRDAPFIALVCLVASFNISAKEHLHAISSFNICSFDQNCWVKLFRSPSDVCVRRQSLTYALGVRLSAWALEISHLLRRKLSTYDRCWGRFLKKPRSNSIISYYLWLCGGFFSLQSLAQNDHRGFR